MTSFRSCACPCQTRRETKRVSSPAHPTSARHGALLCGYGTANVLQTAAEIKFKTKRRDFLKTFLTKRNNAQLSKVFKGLDKQTMSPVVSRSQPGPVMADKA